MVGGVSGGVPQVAQAIQAIESAVLFALVVTSLLGIPPVSERISKLILNHYWGRKASGQ